MTQHILPQQTTHRRLKNALPVTLTALIASSISLMAAAGTPCPPQLSDSDGGSVVSSGDSCPTTQAGNSDTPDYADPLSSCRDLGTRRVVNVTNAAALQQAMSNASCGDTIQMAPGTYGTDFWINKSCPMGAPVVIKGASDFGSTIAGDLKISGDRNIVLGVRFSGPESGVRVGGTNNKLLANKFTDWRHVAVLLDVGKQAEVAYNEFSNPHAWLSSEAGSYPLRIGIRTTEKDPSSFHFDAWVHHNYFHDFPAKPNPDDYNSGQSDAIEVCQSGRDSTADMRTGWYVESNLVERHKQGHGIIDFKCGGNVVRFNSVVDSPGGRIDARNGSYNTFESNWIENSGGAAIHGGHNRVIGNYVRGGPVSVMAGGQEWNTSGGGHPRAYDTLLAGNDASALVIGKAYDTNANYPALGTTVEGNSGPTPVLDVEEQTTIRATTIIRFPRASRLQAGSLGPAALRGAPSSYLACRVP